jgi:hypothetical protein
MPNKPWQTDLITFLENNPPTYRQIIWYFDPTGNTGKSHLTKYLCVTMPTKYHFVNVCGGSRDFATNILNAINRGWSSHCILFDLARDSESKSIYEPLEHVKNGMITATKYQGQSFYFTPPHVVVLANFLPNVLKLSIDRWHIIHILSDFTTRIIPYSEALQAFNDKKSNLPHDTTLTIL